MASKIKIPKIKKANDIGTIETRSGALNLVGYLESLLSVAGKLREKVGVKKYGYDKLLLVTKKDLEKCQEISNRFQSQYIRTADFGGFIKESKDKEKDYFSRTELNKFINMDFLYNLKKNLEIYIAGESKNKGEGSNQDRVAKLKNNKIIEKLNKSIGNLTNEIDKMNKEIQELDTSINKTIEEIKKREAIKEIRSEEEPLETLLKRNEVNDHSEILVYKRRNAKFCDKVAILLKEEFFQIELKYISDEKFFKKRIRALDATLDEGIKQVEEEVIYENDLLKDRFTRQLRLTEINILKAKRLTLKERKNFMYFELEKIIEEIPFTEYQSVR